MAIYFPEESDRINKKAEQAKQKILQMRKIAQEQFGIVFPDSNPFQINNYEQRESIKELDENIRMYIFYYYLFYINYQFNQKINYSIFYNNTKRFKKITIEYSLILKKRISICLIRIHLKRYNSLKVKSKQAKKKLKHLVNHINRQLIDHQNQYYLNVLIKPQMFQKKPHQEQLSKKIVLVLSELGLLLQQREKQ